MSSVLVYASSNNTVQTDEEKLENAKAATEHNIATLLEDYDPVSAYASRAGSYSISRTGLDSLVDYDYLIRSDRLSLKNAILPNNGMFYLGLSKVVGGQDWSLLTTQAYSDGRYTFSNVNYSIRFENCVDAFDGGDYDLIVTIKSLDMVVSNATPGGVHINVLHDESDGTWLASISDSLTDAGVMTGVKMGVRYQIVRHGTNTPVSGYVVAGYLDLDQPDFGVDGVNGRSYDTSIDNYQEGVRLTGGVCSTIRLESDTVLRVQNNNTEFVGTCGTDGRVPLESGISYLADASGWDIEWGGTCCGTRLVLNSEDIFEQYRVTPSKEGPGTISPSSVVTVYSGQNASFSMKADTGAYINSITVDGRHITITNPSQMSYTFYRIQANHTIHVVFEKICYKIRYHGNGEVNPNHLTGEFTQNTVTSVSGMPDSEYEYGTRGSLRKNDFVREGYEFVGWNTKADGTGVAFSNLPYNLDSLYYSDGYNQIYNLTTENGKVFDLYAQWRKKLGSETLTVVSEETGNPVSGVSFKLYKSVNGSWIEVPGVGTKTTDSNGKIQVNDLHWFNYRWVMTGVPVGYQVSSSNVGFTITYNQLSAANQVILYMKRVSVILDSQVSEIIRGEEAPAFLYHVSGTDVAGVKHEYNLMVQTNGSSKYGTNRLTGLFAGTYEVTHVSVSRYVADNVVNVNHSTVRGVNASVDVKNYESAEALFPYSLRQYNGLSHTDSETNKLNK